MIRKFVARVRALHPVHHAIVRGMAWVALFVVLGKLVGATKEMAVAWRYGVNAEVDAYLFVFNLVILPVGVWFSVLTIVLVPLAARIRHDTAAELSRFRSELFGLTILLGIVLAIVAWLVLPLILNSSWTGLPSATAAIAIETVPALILLLPLGLLISLHSAWMLAAGWHANTLLESVPALAILTALLAFPGSGLAPLVWGTVAGFVLHFASLASPLTLRGEIDAPRFTYQSRQWPAFWQGFGIMLASQTLLSVAGIIDQFFAAHLGTGAVATLSYANRILALIVSLGAVAIGRATLPVFSQMQAQGKGQLRRVAVHWMRLLFLLGVVVAFAGWWLAPWMVKLLFERGAFSAQDSTNVTEILRYGMLKLPSYFPLLVISSLIASTRRFRLSLVVAILFACLRTALLYGLVPRLGLTGIMISDALAYGCTLGFFLVSWRRVFLESE